MAVVWRPAVKDPTAHRGIAGARPAEPGPADQRALLPLWFSCGLFDRVHTARALIGVPLRSGQGP